MTAEDANPRRCADCLRAVRTPGRGAETVACTMLLEYRPAREPSACRHFRPVFGGLAEPGDESPG